MFYNTGVYVVNCGGMKYVGASTNIAQRFYDHKTALKAGYHRNRYLQSAYDYFGEKNTFYIVVEFCKRDELVELEEYYIKLFKSHVSEGGCNIEWSARSENAFKSHKELKEERRKVIEAGPKRRKLRRYFREK